MTLEGGHVLFFCSETLEYCSWIITIEVCIILCPVTYFVCYIRMQMVFRHGYLAVSLKIP